MMSAFQKNIIDMATVSGSNMIITPTDLISCTASMWEPF